MAESFIPNRKSQLQIANNSNSRHNITINKKEASVRLKYSCGCSAVVVEKIEWEDGEINFDISIQDSRYDHNYTTLWGRMKTAAKILFGKPVYYSDVCIDKPETFNKFVEDIGRLCVEAKQENQMRRGKEPKV